MAASHLQTDSHALAQLSVSTTRHNRVGPRHIEHSDPGFLKFYDIDSTFRCPRILRIRRSVDDGIVVRVALANPGVPAGQVLTDEAVTAVRRLGHRAYIVP